MIWLLTFLSSLAVSAALTPLAARWSKKIGLIDAPDGHRKLHGQAIPLGGGIAVIGTLGIVGLLLLTLDPQFRQGAIAQWTVLTTLTLATLLLCYVGFLDDWKDIRGRQKLMAQIAAALLVAAGGTTINRVVVFDQTWEMGIFAVPVTCLWLLAVINSVNLIDGSDGLASTVCIIIGITFAVMAEMLGHPSEALIALALVGALSGFLVYNRPPAKIFLGDAGSMSVGLLLGVLAIRSSIKGPATIALGSALAIWSILFFDVAMAIARRKLTGRSFFTTDRGHMHHVLQHHGYGPFTTILIIAGASTICAIGALCSVAWKSELWAFMSTTAVLSLIVGTKLFGYHECELFCRRCFSFARSLFRSSKQELTTATSPGKQMSARFRGNREWDQLWESLVSYSERFDFCRVQLNVCAPSISEEYHAVWTSDTHAVNLDCWSIQVPLHYQKIRVGSISVVGKSVDLNSSFQWLSDLMDGFEAFELQLYDILQDLNEADQPVEIPVSGLPAKLATPARSTI